MSFGIDQPALRVAVASDAAAIVAIHFAAVHRTAAPFYAAEVLAAWSSSPDASRVERMQQVIDAGDERVLVAEGSASLVAFGSIVPRLEELRAVYVHPDAGRRGIGSRMLVALETLAVELGLTGLQLNASSNAEAFYLRCGYVMIERGVHRLQNGVSMACVRMQKRLEG